MYTNENLVRIHSLEEPVHERFNLKNDPQLTA